MFNQELSSIIHKHHNKWKTGIVEVTEW